VSVTVEFGDRRLAAVLFVDVAGYTSLAAKREDEALRLVDLFQSITRDVIDRYHGRLVKFLGDGALIVFSSTDRAARTALKIVSDFEEQSQSIGIPARAHAGLHLGEIVTTADGDAYGDGVNFASRLQTVAQPGQVVASEYVWLQLRRRDDFEVESLGDRKLKDIGEAIAIYGVTLSEGASLEEPQPTVQAAAPMPTAEVTRPRAPRWLNWRGGLAAAVVVLALVLVTWVVDRESEPSAAGDSTVSTAPVAQIDRSIAVLPFQNMSAEQENEYFSDGITDDILTAISKIDDLRVISRTSTMQYKNTDKDLIQIGEELDVATILEGSVRRQGDRVRITAQLVNAETDDHMWAETYDRNLTDIFEIQTEIAEEIAAALQATLTRAEVEAIAAGRTGNLTAYDLYLKGRDYLWDSVETMGRATQGIDTAVDLFNQALVIDPEYARAYAGLGQAYVFRSFFTEASWGDSARVVSQKAIELDPNLADGHYALGFELFQAGDYEGAVVKARRALELNPNYALATDGLAHSLYQLGRLDEALVAAKRTVALEPTDGRAYEMVGTIYIDLMDYAESERWLRRGLTIEPDNGSSHALIGVLQLLQGDLERAAEEIELGRSLEPLSSEVMFAQARLDLERGNYEGARPLIETFVVGLAPELQPLAYLGFVHLKLGNDDEAQELLREAESRARTQIEAGQAHLFVYSYLIQALALQGRVDEAIDVLEEAYSRGFRSHHYIRNDPTFENLHGNERLEALLTRMEADLARMRERVQREGL
jgi:pentatricopeptide repeat protein